MEPLLAKGLPSGIQKGEMKYSPVSLTWPGVGLWMLKAVIPRVRTVALKCTRAGFPDLVSVPLSQVTGGPNAPLWHFPSDRHIMLTMLMSVGSQGLSAKRELHQVAWAGGVDPGARAWAQSLTLLCLWLCECGLPNLFKMRFYEVSQYCYHD
jgi:hypothetical protein